MTVQVEIMHFCLSRQPCSAVFEFADCGLKILYFGLLLLALPLFLLDLRLEADSHLLVGQCASLRERPHFLQVLLFLILQQATKTGQLALPELIRRPRSRNCGGAVQGVVHNSPRPRNILPLQSRRLHVLDSSRLRSIPPLQSRRLHVLDNPYLRSILPLQFRSLPRVGPAKDAPALLSGH